MNKEISESPDLHKKLSGIIAAERVKTRYIDLVSYAADAGFYYLVPKAVVKPVSEVEIRSLFQLSHQEKIPLVFRAGGTSLSGQSITDGILIDLSQYWNKLSVEENGAAVRVQPGITGGMVNAYLKKYLRKIGPDPASINSAMMGGILSNNSSGMCCGVVANSYHTVRHIRFMLPDGSTFSTEQANDYIRFERECPHIFTELAQLKIEIVSNIPLLEKIRKKYRTKNTVGYSLNAFLDYEHPLDILAHALIGAEGTLAFIAEAVMNTIGDHRFKSTALLYFPNVYSACQAIEPLRDAGAAAIELMDRASLRSVELQPGMPASVRDLPADAAALLVEFQENSDIELNIKVNMFTSEVHQLSLLDQPLFTTDPDEQALLWKVRKGLFPAIGSVRASGTTVILEDVAFPIQRLGDAITGLQRLFKAHGYEHAIIFGHAKDGNIHFVITQSLNDTTEINRYDRFLRAVVEFVLQHDGTLKAEHGTGRNIAPFVETEWGGDAYRIMKRLKHCIDPNNLLNPDVIINDDSNAHIRDLKELPTVEQEVDKCIECGYCEHRCPSRDITTTPRRRIVVRRVLKKLQTAGEGKKHRLLLDQYQYDGLDTCAVDGLCATACPVDINTGDLIKRLRRENHSPFNNRFALFVAQHFKTTEMVIRATVRCGNFLNMVLGRKAMPAITHGIRKLIHRFPVWPAELLPPPNLPRKTVAVEIAAEDTHVVYLPACISRLLGSGIDRKKNMMETFISVSNKAGINVVIPENIAGSCCGQIFSSKGFAGAFHYTANQIIKTMWDASKEGRLIIVSDVTSCAYTLHHLSEALTAANRERYNHLRIMDSVSYLHDVVLTRKITIAKKQKIVLHPACSLEKMGTGKKFAAVARAFADDVVVPLHAGCCGMAGDRGFLFPELTSSATSGEAAEVSQSCYDGYYSSTKTCELAMSAAVKANYESILYLADETIV